MTLLPPLVPSRLAANTRIDALTSPRLERIVAASGGRGLDVAGDGIQDLRAGLTSWRKVAMTMHVQVVTYRLGEISDAEFNEANREFADAMALVPGLRAKIWLKDPDGDTYGGVYLWEDRQSCHDFLQGELWGEVKSDESVMDLTSQDYAVNDELTKLTQPALSVL